MRMRAAIATMAATVTTSAKDGGRRATSPPRCGSFSPTPASESSDILMAVMSPSASLEDAQEETHRWSGRRYEKQVEDSHAGITACFMSEDNGAGHGSRDLQRHARCRSMEKRGRGESLRLTADAPAVYNKTLLILACQMSLAEQCMAVRCCIMQTGSWHG